MTIKKPAGRNLLKCVALLCCCCVASLSMAQFPAIHWQNTLGGSEYDEPTGLAQATDGNYYVGGKSLTDAENDKSENNTGSSNSGDIWLLKLSAVGDIIWQNTIGGDYDDGLGALSATSDGGVILGGNSRSPASGDKSEPAFKNNSDYNTFDYWIIKLNADGDIEWENTIGGKGDDFVAAIHQTPDGGYIVGGSSKSSVSGDKTEINIGDFAYWIVKLDASGNIEWQNTIDGINADYLADMQLTSDGGYFVGGYSRSGISGEKTEACFSDSYDYWVLKLNSAGTPVWQNTIGGNNDDFVESVAESVDGGFIISGSSESNATGDKTENKIGGTDFWVIKLDISGNIEWQNTIGGNYNEDRTRIRPDTDGGYALCGTSKSNLSADKTVPNEGDGAGYADYWLLHLNSSGAIEYQDVIGGSLPDYFNEFIFTADGGFLLSGISNSSISGDKSENAFTYSYPPLNSDDYWVVKLEGDICLPATEVCNGMDDDCDGLIDDGATALSVIEATDDLVFCNGGSVPLSVTYTGSSSFQWKRNGNNIVGANSPVYVASSKGSYTCKVITDCGNAISTGIYVDVKKNPNASITAGGPVVFCEGGSVILTANSGVGFAYQWTKNDVDIAGATSINYTATSAGTYKCRVTKAATGCNRLSNPVTVTVPCREGEVTTVSSFTIFPNPTTAYLTIQNDGHTGSLSNTSFQLFSTTGQMILSGALIQDETVLDISGIPSGMYLLAITREENRFVTPLIID